MLTWRKVLRQSQNEKLGSNTDNLRGFRNAWWLRQHQIAGLISERIELADMRGKSLFCEVFNLIKSTWNAQMLISSCSNCATKNPLDRFSWFENFLKILLVTYILDLSLLKVAMRNIATKDGTSGSDMRKAVSSDIFISFKRMRNLT